MRTSSKTRDFDFDHTLETSRKKIGSDEKIVCFETCFILKLDCLLGSGSQNFDSHAFTICRTRAITMTLERTGCNVTYEMHVELAFAQSSSLRHYPPRCAVYVDYRRRAQVSTSVVPQVKWALRLI